MYPISLLIVWSLCQSLYLVITAAASLQRPSRYKERKLGSLFISAICSAIPSYTLILFVRVFVVGGSSTVAQLNGEGRLYLWSMWVSPWPMLCVGNAVVFVIVSFAILLPPHLPRQRLSFLSRVFAVPLPMCAFYALVKLAPDA